MNKMKLIAGLIFSCLIAGQSLAQTVYQSPHVKNGKTFQFTIPAGYFEVANTELEGYSIYANEEGLDFSVDSVELMPIGMFVVIHAPAVSLSFESFTEQVKETIFDNNKEITIVKNPTIEEVNGFDCFLAGLKGTLNEKSIAAGYFGLVEFGDYFIIMSYYAVDGTKNVISFKDFEKTINTLREAETDKENEMEELFSVRDTPGYSGGEGSYGAVPSPPPASTAKPRKDFVEEILIDFFKNDLFETSLSPLDFTPDVTGDWMLPMEGNSHLLFELFYKKDKGSIKIFSGGRAENYSNEEEMSKAILQVFNSSDELGLKFEETFYGEQMKHNKYLVSNGGTIVSVYTSVVNGELIFFVADEGENPEAGFPTEAHNYLVTIWIDAFEGDFFEEE